MRGPYAKRYTCLDCGKPVGMPNARCAPCRKVARSQRNKAYQRQYHDKHRPSPTIRPQANPDLPPFGTLTYDDDGARVFCHVCGKGYGSLVTHIRTHGLDAERYKERYGLARSASLLSPATAEKQRQRAIERDQGSKGIPFGQDHRAGNLRGIERRLQSRIAVSEGHKTTPE